MADWKARNQSVGLRSQVWRSDGGS